MTFFLTRNPSVSVCESTFCTELLIRFFAPPQINPQTASQADFGERAEVSKYALKSPGFSELGGSW